MRVLVVVFPQPGRLHPFLGVAQALEQGGHEVAFFCAEALGPRLARAGLRAPCLGPEAARRAVPATTPRGAAYAERLRNPAWARRLYAQVLLAPVAAQVEALRAAVRALRPDVLCVDSLQYAGAVVAAQESLPWASVAPSLVPLTPAGFRCTYHDALGQLAPETTALLRSLGAETARKHGDLISPWLNAVFATEALVPRAEADNAFSRYAGPPAPLRDRGDEPPFPYERLDPSRPLVYASFGTQVSPPAAVIEALGRALGPEEAQLVVALGGWADEPAAVALPEHVIAVRYAPQRALLQRAAAVVTHGGANGVAEALLCGAPLLVIPLAHEQPLQANLVERRGLGERLALDAVTAEACRGALLRLLGPGAHRERLAAVRGSYAGASAATSIAGWLAELARDRQPLAA